MNTGLSETSVPAAIRFGSPYFAPHQLELGSPGGALAAKVLGDKNFGDLHAFNAAPLRRLSGGDPQAETVRGRSDRGGCG